MKKSIDFKKIRHQLLEQTKKSLPSTILCLSLFFINLVLFGYKNAVIAVSLTIIFNRIKTFSPEDWHPYAMLLINLALAILAHFSSLNLYLGVMLDFWVTYVMVFLLTDSDTSKAYYGYGFSLVFFQSFPTTTFASLGFRFLAIGLSTLLTFFVLFALFYFQNRKTSKAVDYALFNPFKGLGCKITTFFKSFLQPFKELLSLLKHFLSTRQPKDLQSFNFRKTRFAARIALLISFSFFIEGLLGIPKGYWLPLNVFVMTLNFYEDSLLKIKQRVGGNIAGVLISALLLHYLSGFFWHMLILSVATFLAYAVDNYLFRATYMTCYAIALSTLFMKQSEIFELRLAYVFLAAVIAILGSRFIFENRKPLLPHEP